MDGKGMEPLLELIEQEFVDRPLPLDGGLADKGLADYEEFEMRLGILGHGMHEGLIDNLQVRGGKGLGQGVEDTGFSID